MGIWQIENLMRVAGSLEASRARKPDMDGNVGVLLRPDSRRRRGPKWRQLVSLNRLWLN